MNIKIFFSLFVAAIAALGLWAAWRARQRYIRTIIEDKNPKNDDVPDMLTAIANALDTGLIIFKASDRVPIFHNSAAEKIAGSLGIGTRQLGIGLLAHRAAAVESAAAAAPFLAGLATVTGPAGAELQLTVRYLREKHQGFDAIAAIFTPHAHECAATPPTDAALQRAEHGLSGKAAYFAAMSHAIRTPLNTMIGNLELLGHSTLSNEQSDRLKTVQAGTENLLTIINNISDLSKLESAELVSRTADFDICHTVQKSLGLFSAMAARKGLGLYVDFSHFPVFIHGDQKRISQILGNLLSNAIKFTDKGKITVQVRREADCGSDSPVTITVQDTGCGMSADFLEQLFKPFSQADTSSTQRFAGAGLGLALCRQLCSRLDMALTASSTPGLGSRFELRLPGSAGKTPIPHGSDCEGHFPGHKVIFIACDAQWHAYALPHMRRWGLDVAVHAHPGQVDPLLLAQARAVVIFGERDTWPPGEENRLVENSPWIIEGHPANPAHPRTTGRTISVSSYSLAGLLQALQQTMDPAAMPCWTPDGPGAGRAPISSPRILVVEDHAGNQLLFEEQLKLLGCQVRIVSCAQEALLALSSAPWDMVLSDIGLPGMDGYALARTIVQRWPGMTVLAITARSTEEDRLACMASGMKSMLIKPVRLQDLRQALEQYLAPSSEAPNGPSHDQAADHGQAYLFKIPAHVRTAFLDSTRMSIDNIRHASARDDADAVIHELHNLAGSLAFFELTALAKTCVKVEHGIASDGLAVHQQAVNSLSLKLHELMQGSASPKDSSIA